MNYTVGDFILVERPGPASWAIRHGQYWRFRGAERKYARFTHAALIVSEQGDLVEALFRGGVVRSHIDKYREIPYTLVQVNAAPLDQQQILRFASKVVGQDYGYLTLVCTFAGQYTGGKLTIGFPAQAICSGLVARAEERTGAYFDRDPCDICPADLGRYYEVL